MNKENDININNINEDDNKLEMTNCLETPLNK